MTKKGCLKGCLWAVPTVFVMMLLPTKIQNPVEGCGRESYNPKSFWHPWGDHNHRGIDIFARKGTAVHPAIGGIVVATAQNHGAGGKHRRGIQFRLPFPLLCSSERNLYPPWGDSDEEISHWQSGEHGKRCRQATASALQHQHYHTTRRLSH